MVPPYLAFSASESAFHSAPSAFPTSPAGMPGLFFVISGRFSLQKTMYGPRSKASCTPSSLPSSAAKYSCGIRTPGRPPRTRRASAYSDELE